MSALMPADRPPPSWIYSTAYRSSSAGVTGATSQQLGTGAGILVRPRRPASLHRRPCIASAARSYPHTTVVSLAGAAAALSMQDPIDINQRTPANIYMAHDSRLLLANN